MVVKILEPRDETKEVLTYEVMLGDPDLFAAFIDDVELMGVPVFNKGAGRGFEEMGEECSVDQIPRRDWGDGVYNGGRWGWRWDSGNWCTNNGRGSVLNGDVFVEGEGGEQVAFNNVGGVGRDGGDWMGELINETVLGGGEVLVVNDGGVGRPDDKVIKVVAGKLLGGNVGKDVEEGLIVNEGRRRTGDEDGSGGGGCAAGVSGGWEVPGVVRTVEEVLDFLGGGGNVGCVDIVDGRPIK